jgi:hypothetical protein
MQFLAGLNRRHTAALFLTMVVTGACLLLGAGIAESTGTALLGVAVTWAFGSDARVVHWLFVIAGIVLSCTTLALQWRVYHPEAQAYARKVADFERRMPELAKEYPLKESSGRAASAQMILDPSDIDIDATLALRERPNNSGPLKQKAQKVAEEKQPTAGYDELLSFNFRTRDLVTESGLEFTVTSADRLLIGGDSLSKSGGWPPSTDIHYNCEPDGSCALLDLSNGQTALATFVEGESDAVNEPFALKPVDKKNPLRAAEQTDKLDLSAGIVSKSGATAEKGPWAEHTKAVLPDGAVRYYSSRTTDEEIRRSIFGHGRTRKLWDEAAEADLKLSSVPDYELPGEPPEPFHVRALRGWPIHAVSFLLVGLGVGLLVGIRSAPRAD